MIVVATVCRTQFRLWYGSTSVAGLLHVMTILGETLKVVVFHVKVDPDPAADLVPVLVFCGPAHRCRTGGAMSAGTWPYF